MKQLGLVCVCVLELPLYFLPGSLPRPAATATLLLRWLRAELAPSLDPAEEKTTGLQGWRKSRAKGISGSYGNTDKWGRDENEKHFKVIFNVRIELGTVVCGCYFGPFLAWLAMVCLTASTKNNGETVWRVRVLKGPLNRLGGFQDSGFGLEEGFWRGTSLGARL